MYIETSVPQAPGEKARLISPVYQALSSAGLCLNFYYHMYGANTGTLSVYFITGGAVDGSTPYPLGTAIWSRSGDRGNNWHIGQVSLAIYLT